MAGHRMGALEGGRGVPNPPFQCIPGAGGGSTGPWGGRTRRRMRIADPPAREALLRRHHPTTTQVRLCVTRRPLLVSLRGPGQSPGPPFAGRAGHSLLARPRGRCALLRLCARGAPCSVFRGCGRCCGTCPPSVSFRGPGQTPRPPCPSNAKPSNSLRSLRLPWHRHADCTRLMATGTVALVQAKGHNNVHGPSNDHSWAPLDKQELTSPSALRPDLSTRKPSSHAVAAKPAPNQHRDPNQCGPYARCTSDKAVAWPWVKDGPHPLESLWEDSQSNTVAWRGEAVQQPFPRPNDIYSGGGGGSCQVKFMAVDFAVGNFAEPLDFVWHPPPESTMCTAAVREIRGGP